MTRRGDSEVNYGANGVSAAACGPKTLKNGACDFQRSPARFLKGVWRICAGKVNEQPEIWCTSKTDVANS